MGRQKKIVKKTTLAKVWHFDFLLKPNVSQPNACRRVGLHHRFVTSSVSVMSLCFFPGSVSVLRRVSLYKRLGLRRQLAASDTALATCWTAHQLQAGRADVQDSADVIPAVSEPAHLVAHQRTQHSIVIRPTAVRTFSTDIIRQTIVQHCRTPDLELTATCCVKLRLSLYFQIQT